MSTETETAHQPQNPDSNANRDPSRLRRLGIRAGQFLAAAAGLAIVFGPAANEVPVVRETPGLNAVGQGANMLSDVATDALKAIPGSGLVAPGTGEVPGTGLSVENVAGTPDRLADVVEDAIRADEIRQRWIDAPAVEYQQGVLTPQEDLVGDANDNGTIDSDEIPEIKDQLGGGQPDQGSDKVS
jgi:hypothetical protein